ncbi:hypothetical protein ABZV60_15365 [Streptomyces sp. NPDC004787]|uniref:hypothetical protein n=1 Tax=Streptomyces sp. NPDC004787 TaxID=3154291 RepID=UPI0033B92DFF
MRLCTRRTPWPPPAPALTDTTRPECPRCGGAGGHAYDYGDYKTSDHAGTEWDPCPCRTSPTGPWGNGYSHEPPF